MKRSKTQKDVELTRRLNEVAWYSYGPAIARDRINMLLQPLGECRSFHLLKTIASTSGGKYVFHRKVPVQMDSPLTLRDGINAPLQPSASVLVRFLANLISSFDTKSKLFS